MSDYLVHHGVKGQKWGVRRYQNYDGSLTAQGKRHYYVGEGRIDSFGDVLKNSGSMSKSELSKYLQTHLLGKNKVDTFLKRGTTLSRIQNKGEFENFAFYATYKKHDVNQYAGLFGKNLKDRAAYEAKKAKREGAENAQELKEKAQNMKIYQLSIKATKKLKIPSDENASKIVKDLSKDEGFKKDLIDSIADSKSKMRRPSQQDLFSHAQNVMRKDSNRWSNRESETVYRALNLSLTNHNQSQINVQTKFYSALKKGGYSALVDINDKEYSSYHAKRPVIVFDTAKVTLKAVSTLDDKKVERLYKHYMTERVVKDTLSNAAKLPSNVMNLSISAVKSKLDDKTYEYLERSA